MKKLINTYFIFLIVFAHTAYSQKNEFDSIEAILKSKIHDTAKCNILANFIESGLEENVWPIYNEKLLLLSQKAIKTAPPNLLNSYYIYYTSALSNKGYLATDLGDFVTAEKYYKQTLEIQKKFNFQEGIGNTYINLGAAANSQGNVKLALEYYHSALKIFIKNNNTNNIAVAYNNLAYLFSNENNYKTSTHYYELALQMHRKMNDLGGMATVFGNLAYIYSISTDNDSVSNEAKLIVRKKSLNYLERAEKIQDSLNQKNNLARTLNQIGGFYEKYGNIKLEDKKYNEKPKENFMQEGEKIALQYYMKALKIRLNSNHSFGLIQSYNSLAKYMYKKNKINDAIKFSIKCLELSEKANNLEFRKSASKLLYSCYKTKNNYNNALKMYQVYIYLNDSLNNNITKKAIIQKTFQIEYEKKAAADSVKVVEEKKLNQVKLNQEKTQRYYLYIGLSLVGIFALFMVNRFRVTNKQKKLIELQKQEVEKQKHLVDEKQKEILDSIRYAKRIQQALLPNKNYINKALKK